MTNTCTLVCLLLLVAQAHAIRKKRTSRNSSALRGQDTEEERKALPNQEHHSDVELVVTAFEEPLSWIDPMVEKYIPGASVKVYCKSKQNKDKRCEYLKNRGSEEYGYLTHIIQRYNTLAPVTVFASASIQSPFRGYMKCRKLNFVLSQLDTKDKVANFRGFSTIAADYQGTDLPFEPNFDLHEWQSDCGQIGGGLCRPSVSPFGSWYAKFVNASQEPGLTGVSWNGVFAVSAERIRRYNLTTYEGLLAEVGRCGYPLTAGHYMERTWRLMFDDPGHTDSEDPGLDECPQIVEELAPYPGGESFLAARFRACNHSNHHARTGGGSVDGHTAPHEPLAAVAVTMRTRGTGNTIFMIIIFVIFGLGATFLLWGGKMKQLEEHPLSSIENTASEIYNSPQDAYDRTRQGVHGAYDHTRQSLPKPQQSRNFGCC